MLVACVPFAKRRLGSSRVEAHAEQAVHGREDHDPQRHRALYNRVVPVGGASRRQPAWKGNPHSSAE